MIKIHENKTIIRPILIEPIKEEEKTKTGILLPETAEKERPEQGKVIAVGPGRRTDEGKIIPLEVKAGEKVFLQNTVQTK